MVLFGATPVSVSTFGLTIDETLKESLAKKDASGCLSVMTTVFASGASIDFRVSVIRKAADPDTFSLTTRSIEYLTALASSAEPSENLSPSFSVNVYLRPSGVIVGRAAAASG